MKIGKRLLSVLLCLAMMLSMLSTFVFAETKVVGASIPTGNANSLTGANPTTDVALTITDSAVVVDGTVNESTTSYVLDWNGTKYENMFKYGENLFNSLAEAQSVVAPGGTVLVKSLPAKENGVGFIFTKGANFYTENYNTLPYVVGTAFDGSDWTANEEYAAKAVTLGNIKFQLADADANDSVQSAGTIALYGFSFKLSGTAAISFNEMPDLFANFIIQNAAVNVSGGSPVIAANSYANGEKANAKGASILFKNFYMTGSSTRLFTEYYPDYFTLDGWFIPDEFGDTTYLMYHKIGASSGKSTILITNSNFQNWKGHIYFQMNNGKNWFASKSDSTISESKSDIDWRPVHITNNIFNNSSLWDKSAFHQVVSNSTSRTVITGNRIINKETIVPFLKNNHATYGNYFSIDMYNNYIEGYDMSPDFASSFMTPQQGVTPYADIRNNYFSDNTAAKLGTDYWVGCTGNSSKDVHATDWYVDAEMTLLNSEVKPLQIKTVIATNGTAGVYNLSSGRTIVYNLKEGTANLEFTFETDGAQVNWYSDLACTQPLDPSTIKAGDSVVAYLKVAVPEKTASLTYTVYIFKSENMFSEIFESDKELLTKDMLLVSNMNDDALLNYSLGQPLEYVLPSDGKTYTFVKGVNAFSTVGDALSFAKSQGIETANIYFDYSKEGATISISQSARIIAPNFETSPFDDKGYSTSSALSDGTGEKAWSYNTNYDANKRTVAKFVFSGKVAPVVEIYGVELKGSSSAGTEFNLLSRSAEDAAAKLVFQNILITNATSSIFKFCMDACVEDDSALIKNLYLRSSLSGGQLSLNSEYMPETVTFDGLFADYNQLGNDNKNSTRWYLKQGNSNNTLTFKNCNLRNFYNETNRFLTFMGHGERPKEDAGACKLVFEHNILYSFATGMDTFLFDSAPGNYTNIVFKNNYISAPNGKSLNLIESAKSATQLRLDITGNIFKGLNDIGAERALSTNSDIKMNYSTKVSSTDNTAPGNAIILNGTNTTLISKNHYLDYDMTLLNVAVEISDVAFSKGILEENALKYKYTGIVKEGTPATVADFTFTMPEEGDYIWYEDSELTKAISNDDLSKVDMYYTPVYLKVFAKGNPNQYIAYCFDLRTEPTPKNLFTEKFTDPAGIIDIDKAFIVSKNFEKYSDGAYVEASFGSDTLYSFVKGENAFNTYKDVLDYAEENGISTPHILVHDYTGLDRTSANASNLGVDTPAYFFTQNYNVSPVIKGSAVDGSDWSGNIGTGEGQFDPDKSVEIAILTFNSLCKSGEYRFYGFTLTGSLRDNTQRKQNIDISLINTYFDRQQWNIALFAFNKPTSMTAAQKAFTETFTVKNMYFHPNSMTAAAKFFDGNLPSTVIIDGSYFGVERDFTAGLNTHEFTCNSTTRSFQLRNTYLKDFFYKSTAKLMKNTQTGSDVTAKEYAELVIDGCTLVDVSFNGKGVFSGDLDGLNLVQITNNKIFNKKINLAPIASMNTTDAATIKMKLVMKNNYFNAIKTAALTLKRTLTDDSVVEDNYAIATHKAYDGSVTYGGVALSINSNKGDYFVDSELKYHRTDAIPATFVGEKTQVTATGAKYLLTENDPVLKSNGDGTYELDLSSIVKNPAGNKVEISYGGVTKLLSEMPMTITVDDASEVTITVIGYALEGDDTVESLLVLSTKIAQVESVKVGGNAATKNGDAFSIVLAADGKNEQIDVTTLATGTAIEITDKDGNPVTNVDVLPEKTATYKIVASIGDDVKTYTLTVSREAGDVSDIVAELEELIAKATAEKDENGRTWLVGAKEEVVEKISNGYAAIDGKLGAAALTQAIAELEDALENAQLSAGIIDTYNVALSEAKAVTNEDGKYCTSSFEALQTAIAVAERSIETASDVQVILDIITGLDNAVEDLATHNFTNYVHDEGSENCSSNGTMTSKCDTEGCTKVDTIAETEDYKNDSHNFVDYVYNGDATLESDGTETGHCSRCEETDTRTAVGTMLEMIDSSVKFNDIKADDWFKDEVDYVSTYGIMNGTGEGFTPNGTLTRAQFVMILANIANVKLDNNVDSGFNDVATGIWYTGAVKWAAENGITSGVGGGKFAPDLEITRQQMCVMLVNFATKFGITLDEKVAEIEFADEDKIATWAKDAVKACQKAGIISGVKTGEITSFNPEDTATRAQAAIIMSIFHSDYIA